MNIIYKFILSDVGRVIWDNLNDYNDWTFSDHTIIHKKYKICLWTSNGPWFFDGYDPLFTECLVPKLGLIERHFLYSKYKKMRKSMKNSVNQKICEIIKNNP